MLDIGSFLYAVCFKVLQGFVVAAPTLLVGLFIAGVLRAVVGPEKIRRLFSGDGIAGLLRVSLLASLTPVCALGVLPIVRELRRAGLPTAKILTFGLSAPMLNPITLVYGWTVLPLQVFALIVLTTLVVSIGVGWITGQWADSKREIDRSEWPTASFGLRRMANLGMATSRAAVQGTCFDVAVCMLIYGVIAALIPAGWFLHHMPYRNPTAPLVMLLATPTAYVDPFHGIVQVYAISSVQFSLGAAVVLHVFGVGINSAGVVWLYRLHGLRRLLSLGMIVFAVTLGIGYGANALLDHPRGTDSHTEALDGLTRPAASLGVGFSKWDSLVKRSLFDIPQAFLVSAWIVIFLAVCGSVLVMGRIRFFDDVQDESESSPNSAIWNRPFPKHLLALIAVTGLLALLVMLIYVYYPAPEDIFEDMSIVRTDAILFAGPAPEIAEREFKKLGNLVDKLPISMALRGRTVTDEAREATREYRRMIEDARTALQDGRAVDPKLRMKLRDVSKRCRRSLLGEET